jgi:peroxiredoxin
LYFYITNKSFKGKGKFERERKISDCFIILIIVVIFSTFSIVKLVRANNRLREHLPYLIAGEKIKNFDLIGMNNERITLGHIRESKKPILIFIFSRPCTPCNANIVYWKRMSEILKGRAIVYGIVLDDFKNANDFSLSANLNFDIYVPDQIGRFIKCFRLKFNLSQTILYHSNKVKLLKSGDLSNEDAFRFINIAKFTSKNA